MNVLKSLSIDIGTQVRKHNRLLKDVDDDFDSTLGEFDLMRINLVEVASQVCE